MYLDLILKTVIVSCILIVVSDLTRDDDTIIDGAIIADRAKFKYQALIKFDDNDSNYCGGTIISTDLILTAAHCFKIPHKDVKVIVGNLKVSDDLNAVSYNVRQVIIHEEYNEHTFANDIALIKLASHLYFDENVDKIALNKEEIPIGTDCTVSGWGIYDKSKFMSSEDLREVEVKIVDEDNCREEHNKDILAGMLCAGKIGEDICKNDSGGPLVCDNVLVGIVSWGAHECVDRPEVYTNVSYYSSWIASARSKGNSSIFGFCVMVLLIVLMLLGV